MTFSALSEIVKAHAGVLETDDQRTASVKLATIAPDRPDREWLCLRLGALIGLDAPEATRDENFAAWSAFVEALAAQRPLVLVFEDLHWADEALLAFLDHLATHVHDVPLLVIATARPELFQTHAGLAEALGRVSRITLDPLTRQDTQRLAAVLLRDVHQSARDRGIEAASAETRPGALRTGSARRATRWRRLPPGRAAARVSSKNQRMRGSGEVGTAVADRPACATRRRQSCRQWP